MTMQRWGQSVIMICASAWFIVGAPVHALDTSLDTDRDGLSDSDEQTLYGTDPKNADTDDDGYTDGEELGNAYSPLKGKKKKLTSVDSDGDGLNDAFELAFGSNPTLKDSDNDGFDDKKEIWSGYDPRTSSPKKIAKKIVVTLAKQRLSYYVNDIRLGTAVISSGKWNLPTPKGAFDIQNKSLRAWSKLAGLWMPYWMGFNGGKFGIHELPEWPNGYKEGENHLGKPVSHGCIRLGVADAQTLYEWTPVGTKLIIK